MSGYRSAVPCTGATPDRSRFRLVFIGALLAFGLAWLAALPNSVAALPRPQDAVATLPTPSRARGAVAEAQGAVAGSTTITLPASADARISAGAPGQVYGSDPQLVVAYSAGGGLDLSLIRFPTGDLPAGITITRAILRVSATDRSGATNSIPVSVRRVTSGWEEGAVNWTVRPSVGAVVTTTATSGFEWVTWDITALAREWSGGHTNYGLQLGGPNSGQYGLYISSREGLHAPELVVRYEEAAAPTAIPTVTSHPTVTRTPTGPSPTTTPSSTPTTTTPPYWDLGDAPDSSNSYGISMTAYSGVYAQFPTVFEQGSPPYGPRHGSYSPQFFLGNQISGEFEADYGGEQDPAHNVVPQANLADQDRADDGLALPTTFSHCQLTTLQFTVTVVAGAPGQAYANLWVDWNRNGRWGDILECQGAAAPEWAVQNQVISLSGPGTLVIATNAFLPFDANSEQAMWLRITLAEDEASSANGGGPRFGYSGGETEDYLLRGVPAPTSTATATERPSFTPPPTLTATPTRPPSATPTDTPTPRPTDAMSPTPTATPTRPPTATPTDTPTLRPTFTVPPTRTETATRPPLTATGTRTHTPTPSATPTLQPSATPYPTGTHTLTLAPTRTRTPTGTLTATFTPGATPTATPTWPNLPDLVVTDMWLQDNHICYQLVNGGIAAAAPGHRTQLRMDGAGLAEDSISVTLAAGQRLRRCFEPAWRCEPHGALTVCVDQDQTIAEGDETNNCIHETWRCDTSPPQIISGPTVMSITQDSALVVWGTDEDSDSRVQYGQQAGRYAVQQSDGALVKHHQLTLTGLSPSSVYGLVVTSADSSGNSAHSGDVLFTTLAAADGRDPSISIADPGLCRDRVTIRADASDDQGVDKVAFSLDGMLIDTDYSSPYGFTLDTREWPNGDHTLVAIAHDLSGRNQTAQRTITVGNLLPDLIAPTVWIVAPQNGETVGHGTVEVTVTAYDQNPNHTGSGAVARVDFYLDGEYKWSDSVAETLYTYVYPWNTVIKAAGAHAIHAIAYDDAGNSATDAITVTVPSDAPALLEPRIEITRLGWERDGTNYRTGWRLENVGAVQAYNVEVWEGSSGFQVRHSGEGPLNAIFTPMLDDCMVMMGGALNLAPGETEELWYRLVPYLSEHYVDYEIGKGTVVLYDGPSGNHYMDHFYIPVTGKLEVPAALASASYLIVTNPERLFDYYNDSNVNELLLTAAQLAGEKSGVLGYLDYYDWMTLDRLVRADGDWGSQLFAQWGDAGYLLLIGETEIVPSVTVYDAEVRDGIEDWGEDVYPVSGVDNWYADTTGADLKPELVMGRIIGDDVASLILPIEASLESQFDCSRALLISGIGNCQDDFYDNVEQIHFAFAFRYDNIAVIHGADYGSDQGRTKAVLAVVEDRDVILYQGHGSYAGWSHTLHTCDLPINLGDSHPLVFGSACSNGAYAGNYSIAEAFLDSGAGVFIGSVESSPIGTNCDALSKFAEQWGIGVSHSSSGTALKHTKRTLLEEDPESVYRRLWAMEYNLYGDPRYAVCDNADNSGPAAMANAEPMSSLNVTMPDYVVSSSHGIDDVQIPGGAQLIQPGRPVVPFYVASLDYPSGYAIRGVTLTNRSGLMTTTGLSLPLGNMALAAGSAASAAVSSEAPWYPQDDYGWSTFENADGSSTLIVRMYPFYYNVLTTDAEFYKSYQFAIDYGQSSVQVTHLETNEGVYEPGENVVVNIGLDNTGDAQNVIVSALVKSYGSGQTVDGLLLRQISNLQGTARFAPSWSSGTTTAGAYCVEVTVTGPAGSILDRRTVKFVLGVSAAEIASLTATPDHFQPGDAVSIQMVVSSTGSIDLNGSAILRIQDEAGAVVQEFSHELSALAPGEALQLTDVWDTSGAGGDSYHILGYVLYDSRSTEPNSVALNAIPPAMRVYLPTVLRGPR